MMYEGWAEGRVHKPETGKVPAIYGAGYGGKSHR